MTTYRYFLFFAFLLLFPGDGIAHYLVGETPLFYIGSMALVAILLAERVFNSIRNKQLVYLDRKTLLALGLFFAMFSSAIICASSSPHFKFVNFSWLFAKYLLYALVGFLLIKNFHFFQNKTIRYSLLFAFVSSVLILGPFLNLDSMTLTFIFEDRQVNYIRTAESFFYLTLLLFILQEKKYLKWSLWLFGWLCLYAINSRLYLYLWILLPSLYYVSSSKWRKAIAAVPASALIVYLQINVLSNPLSRQNILLSSAAGTNNSFRLRKKFFYGGWEQILESPISGSYKGYIDLWGVRGSYIHNILSYWQVYGLLAFLSLILIIGLSTPAVLKPDYSTDKSAIVFSRLCLIYAIFSAALSLGYVFPIIFFGIGAALATQNTTKGINIYRKNQTSP